MSDLAWESLERLGPAAGASLLALVAASLVAAGFALVAARRARTALGRLGVVVPAVLLGAGAVAVFAASTASARDAHIGWLIGGAHIDCVCAQPPIALEALALGLLAPVLALAVPATVLAVGRALRSPALCASAAVAGVAGAAAAWSIASMREAMFLRGFHPPEARWRLLSEVASFLDLAAWGVAAVALAALVVLVTRRASRPRLLAALAVFALGAGAFAATRGHAADRHLRLSLLGPAIAVPRAPSDLGAVACVEPPFGPWLEVFPDGSAALDHRPMTLESLPRDLETLRRNAGVLRPGEPPPRVLNVAAESRTPLAELAPWLETAAAAGLDRPHSVLEVRRRATSRVLGTVELGQLCAFPIPTEGMPADGTLGDWLRATR